MIQREILEKIKAYETLIIHRHERPDPDALGSQLGLAAILRASFPEKTIYCVGDEEESLKYMGQMDSIADEIYQGALVIVTDTANAPRISDKRYGLGELLIKIDHHPNDEPYGDIMWVFTEASSCSEIIYDFYRFFSDELVMTDEAARLLYAGIVGDTGRFLYPSTTSHTLKVASELRKYAFDAALINRQISEIPWKVARLMGYMLENIECDDNGVARVILPYSLLEKYNVADGDTAGLIPVPGNIDKVVMWALFVEQEKGFYRVRLRSKGPTINGLAREHHGGGHPLASGASARDLAEVDVIYQKMRKLVAKSKQS
ncbi:DHH family phosphoesterase [Vagococcus elongatus]|uniref:DHH family phosphoesterase n=1 Tax=Vagococcus elongatus TaxID=180344 RepID=A0A430B491_9ENTE|nr:bifunctional oligoribonuclease/PAP phosphatase NrnA [Vagococcus elongatus]RSU15160.1 DHH family phosphoesterase [Vagococcus elongatus]